jgi:hypothetical protein
MVSGIVYSESPGPSPQVAMDVPNHAINEQDMSAPLMELGQTPAERLVSSPASTDPLMQPAARSAFDFVQPVATQPVALTNF